MFYLILHENICCEYPKHMFSTNSSNEYPKHMFSWRKKKNIDTFGLKSTLSRPMLYIFKEVKPSEVKYMSLHQNIHCLPVDFVVHRALEASHVFSQQSIESFLMIHENICCSAY